MKIRLLSDIHLEMSHIPYVMEPMADDKDSTLVLAGDIGLLDVPQTYMDFLSSVSKQFKYVFWIGGNHEWYHGNIAKDTIEDAIKDFPNVFTNKLILDDENVVILGCTLWTDMAGGDEVCMHESERCMNDYHLIKTISNGVNYHKFTPKNSMMLHYKQKRQLFDDVDHYTQAGFNVVVASHHHPSFKGVQPQYAGHILNGAYCSVLDEDVEKRQIKYWICGHMHERISYEVGSTKVICNPRGYPGETRNNGFNPKLYINTENWETSE